MIDYANEHEQWQAIKGWFKQNGLFLAIVIILSLAASFGWRYWQQHALEKRQEASQLYDQLLTANQLDASGASLTRIADELQREYPRTPYASLAALLEAKAAVSQNNLTKAADKLQWIIQKTGDDDLRTIAQLRLARILLAQKQPDQALQLLNQVKEKDYLAAVDQVRGDIYLSQGKTAQARDSYQAARAVTPAMEAVYSYLDQQLNRLPGA
jgi:predicted negative regulator of RcsB-dependent stress response